MIWGSSHMPVVCTVRMTKSRNFFSESFLLSQPIKPLKGSLHTATALLNLVPKASWDSFGLHSVVSTPVEHMGSFTPDHGGKKKSVPVLWQTIAPCNLWSPTFHTPCAGHHPLEIILPWQLNFSANSPKQKALLPAPFPKQLQPELKTYEIQKC